MKLELDPAEITNWKGFIWVESNTAQEEKMMNLYNAWK